ncbi:MAG TPA: hypothetical protein VGS62_10225 [Streptosporangiaceae bacterium]|nr:hypothetical protein [Streptosporangiaceae bacterium]
MSAVQAIAPGRSPRPAHGYGAHRLLSRARHLPRPQTIGPTGPFARPTRTLVTAAAVVFGVTAVIFAAGLRASLNRVQADLSRAASEQGADPPGRAPGPSPDQRAELGQAAPGRCPGPRERGGTHPRRIRRK